MHEASIYSYRATREHCMGQSHCNSATGIKETTKTIKIVKQCNVATMLHCNSATGIKETTKTIKLVKQCNVATMLHCNSVTEIKNQQQQ